MNIIRCLAVGSFAACAFVFASTTSPAVAQKADSAAAEKTASRYVLLPGMLTGPGAIGRRRFCDARSAGLTQLQEDWIARLVKPNEAQKKALDDLAAASGKAIEMFASACPKRAPRLQTAAEQFEMMEKRIDNDAQAAKTVRPAFTAFYSSLDDKQKAKLDELGPKRSGWLW
jgi:hypothetical protein